MQLKRLSLFLTVSHKWRALLPGPQVECASTHWDSNSWGRASTSISTSTSTRAAHDPIETAAVQANRGVGQMLPPLLYADILPRFVRCQRRMSANPFSLSHWVANPLKAADPGTRLPISVSLTVHPSDWNPDDYVSSCAPQLHMTGHHTALTPTPAASSIRGQAGGSAWEEIATLAIQAFKDQKGRFLAVVRAQDMPEGYGRKAYDVVLQEQVGSTAFILHLKQHAPDAPRHDPRVISPAGQGPGLQVFPGSTPVKEGTSVQSDKKRVMFRVPKALVISQLSPTTTFPTVVTLIIKDLGLQGKQLDEQMTVRLYKSLQTRSVEAWPDFRVFERQSNPVAAYAGRRIIRMALTTDKQLTLYLAPAAAAA